MQTQGDLQNENAKGTSDSVRTAQGQLHVIYATLCGAIQALMHLKAQARMLAAAAFPR